MSHWVLIVAPLVLASFVMLFAFVGCFLDSSGLGGPVAYSDSVLANDSLVGYWRLGDAARSTTAVDSKGDNDGTYVGNVTLGEPSLVAGVADPAARFDGSTAYVSVPFDAALNPAKFTVEAVVEVSGNEGQFRAVASSRDIVGDTATTFGFILYASDANNWQAWVGDGTTNVWQVVTGPDVTPGKHYVAMTYNGQTLKLYVDPGEVDAPATADVAYSPNTARELRIGSGANESETPQFFWNGVLDDVAIYNVDLSFEQIQAHHSLATTGSLPETEGEGT
jgi:hypothetical protein